MYNEVQLLHSSSSRVPCQGQMCPEYAAGVDGSSNWDETSMCLSRLTAELMLLRMSHCENSSYFQTRR